MVKKNNQFNKWLTKNKKKLRIESTRNGMKKKDINCYIKSIIVIEKYIRINKKRDGSLTVS